MIKLKKNTKIGIIMGTSAFNKLGAVGDIAVVKRGYANYLINNHNCVLSSKLEQDKLNQLKQDIKQREETLNQEYKSFKQIIEFSTILLDTLSVNKYGSLWQSVSVEDVRMAIISQYPQFKKLQQKIYPIIPRLIKKVGHFDINLKLGNFPTIECTLFITTK